MISAKGNLTGNLNNKQTINGVVSTGIMYVGGIESDPTVPEHVKSITKQDIENWNSSEPSGIYIGTEEPTDEDTIVWINPEGSDTVEIATKDYVDEAIRGVSGGSGEGGTTNYNLLFNKPTINNVELSGNVTLDELGVQPAGDYASNNDIPTKTSELTNDSGYLTEHQDISHLATKEELPTVPTDVSAFNNDIGYLTEHQDISHLATKNEIPIVPTKTSELTNDSGYLTSFEESDPTVPSHVKAITEEDINNWNSSEPSGIHIGTDEPLDEDTIVWINPEGAPTTNIATEEYVNEAIKGITGSESGTTDYEQLTNKPTINNIELSGNVTLNDLGIQAAGDYATKDEIPTVPTNVSAFNNDKGYLTEIPSEYITESEMDAKGYLTEHQDLSNYLPKNNTTEFTPVNDYNPATKQYVDSTIVKVVGDIKTTDFQTIDTLPTDNISTNTIYLVPKEDSKENNIYEEYIYVNNDWEKIGETTVDLSQYYTKDEIDDKGYLTEHQDISHLATKSEIPTVPTDVSAFNNDAGYLTSFEEADPTVPSHVKAITEAEISKWNSMRNIYASTSAPTANDGANGDIWIIYEE